MSQFCIILLMLDAAWVARGLIKKKSMWPWICGYWLILTAKNLFDLLGW